MDTIGTYLKREREVRQISVEELAQNTRIPLNMLHALEADEELALPADVFVRGYVRSYCRALGIDAEAVLVRFDRATSPGDVAAPISALTPPEKGRNVGMAVAMVILVVLFSIALSVVLRPRHREVSIELAEVSSPAVDVVHRG